MSALHPPALEGHHPHTRDPDERPPVEVRGGRVHLPHDGQSSAKLDPGPELIPATAYSAAQLPIDMEPGEHLAEVIEALHVRFPGKLWRCNKRVHWLEDSGRLEPLGLPEFRGLIPDAAVFLVGERDPKAKRIPRAVVDDVYHRRDLAPVVHGVRRCPWVTSDGEVVTTPGEHDGWLLHWDGEEAHPDDVSDEQMWDVLDRLLDLPFRAESDRIAYLGLLLRCVRPMAGAPSPLTVITATTARSSKTYAAKLLGLILLGEEPSAQMPVDGVELDYTLQTYVRYELPLLWVDNVSTGAVVGGASLHNLMTASGHTSSRTVRTSDLGGGDPTRSIWVVTGNQLSVDDEQARRTVLVNLRRRRDDEPFLTPNLLGWAMANRRLIVSALLRFAVEWHRRGERAPDRTLDSFERWSTLIGGPLSELAPGGRDAWLSEGSRPLPPDEAEWCDLFEQHWTRDKGGRHEPLRASEVLALVDLYELAHLQEVANQGRGERGRATKIGLALKSISRRDVPLASRWAIQPGSDRDGTRYRPVRVDSSPGGPARPPGDLRDPPPKGSAPKVGVSGRYEERAERAEPFCASDPLDTQVSDLGRPPVHPPSLDPDPYKRSVGSARSSYGGCTPTMGAEPLRNPGEPLQGDPCGAFVAAMASRGVRVDPYLWRDRYQAAEVILAGRSDDASRDRLRSMRAYGPAVWALASHDAAGRVHCKWRLEGTGRIRSVSPNLQGVTKAYGLRDAVIAAEGHRLVSADWDAAHVWLAAGRSGDEELLAALDRGDLYAQGAEVWAPELEGQDGRRAAKVAILSSLNGAGPEKLSEILGRFGASVSGPDAHARRRGWLAGYPALQQWLHDQYGHRAWRTHLWRWVQMPTDVGDHAAVGWWLQSAESDALRLVLQRYNGRIVLTNQDEVLAEEPAELAGEQAEHLRDVMDQALAEVAGIERTRRHHSTTSVDVRDSWGER